MNLNRMTKQCERPSLRPHIVILQGAFLPVPPVAGGAVEKLWFQLGQELASNGNQVTHISCMYSGFPAQAIEKGVQYLRVKSFSRPGNRLLTFLFDLIYTVRAIRAAPAADLVVTNTFFGPIVMRFLRNEKIYVSVHRLPRSQYWLYRNASRFQCVSSSVANELVKRYPWAATITRVIPNFVPNAVTGDFSVHRVSRTDFPAARRILYVGRLHPEKGVHLLISAYCKLPSKIQELWHLHIVGPWDLAGGGGGKGFKDRLNNLAMQAKGNIIFHSATYCAEELTSHYAAADLFVYPSLARFGEAFGLAPLEAMSHGVPAIVSNLDCFTDFITHNKNGWIFEAFVGNADNRLTLAIENAIACLQADAEEFRMAACDAAGQFSLEKVALALAKDFHEILGR